MASAATVTGDAAMVASIDGERMPDPRPPPETATIPEGDAGATISVPMAQAPASIPASAAALQEPWRVNQGLAGFVRKRRRARTATLDMDAALIESRGRQALHSRKGCKACQPLDCRRAEQELTLHAGFRDGDVPAGFERLRALKGCLEKAAALGRAGNPAPGWASAGPPPGRRSFVRESWAPAPAWLRSGGFRARSPRPARRAGAVPGRRPGVASPRACARSGGGRGPCAPRSRTSWPRSANPLPYSGGIFDPEESRRRLAELNAEAENPALWDEPERAQRVMRSRSALEGRIAALETLEQELEDAVGLVGLAEEEGDEDTVAEAERDLRALRATASRRATEALLSGEADGNDCYLEIHAGAGGTESQDWAEMLLRMYLRWSEAHDCEPEILSRSDGEEAGVKSATVRVKGDSAYGWLKTESGVHRLVRISPFDAQSRRHTSFASVGIYPVVDDDFEVAIEDKDLRVDTYRASGAGGQHVNKSDSAVRIVHQPTGIVVQCQSQRSQHQNRATAMRMLRSRLFELELQRREEERQAMVPQKTEIGWGHQIRSYVLQPHQMVKDLRTGVETSNPQAVLDGEIDAFLSAALAARLGGGGDEAE